MAKILLSAGGSGGHITPLQALVEHVQAKFPEHELIYIGEKYDQETLAQFTSMGVESHGISAGKFRRYSGSKLLMLFRVKDMLLNTRDLFRYLAGKRQAKKLLRQIKPDIVLCKGSYVSVPVGKAAQKLHIPYIVHESDSKMGLANKKLASKALRVAVSWPIDLYQNATEKFTQTGVPLRDVKADPVEVCKRYGLDANKPLLLVYGGSLGAVKINIMLGRVIGDLSKLCQVLWVCGPKHLDTVTKQLSSIDHVQENVVVRGYIVDGFIELLASANIIAGRGGATTLFDLSKLQKPGIIIPSSSLADQIANVEYLTQKNAVLSLSDAQISSNPTAFLDLVKQLLEDPAAASQIIANLSNTLPTNGTERLTQLLLAEISKSNSSNKNKVKDAKNS